MEQLSGAVCDLASEVVSVLRDGDHRPVAGAAAQDGEAQALGVAAVRVLGADVLLPSVLFRRSPEEADLALVREAVRAYPPGEDAPVSTAWSHWGMVRALHRGRAPEGGPREPDVSWAAELPWQPFTHQLSLLAALAVPETGVTSGVGRAAAARPVDLARGFVRAVRRRDWLQAAGAGRWLAALESGPYAGGVPESLGLDSGLEFVLRMGGEDPRVALHAHAAQLMRGGHGPVAG
ncbi:hypothetical protein [Streptomyces boncukensis]|uniref:Uncharacterized protein n=1 Tax=Streptomyces boncukensis TaxID=2711219 RepID=A0A6G4X699_9ACTN|nr:hypothetical protein [Streptomyces boncukensis]NGO72377.1 hypothetical protein [Streptomyces boncukensis]